MVQQFALGPSQWRFVLRPNCSASWRQVKCFFALTATICLSIAVGFAVVGYWPVLPFAGAELTLLAFALWWSSRKSQRTEVVAIDSDDVEIEKGECEPIAHWRFPRAWARVALEPSPIAQHPSRLLIGSHGKHVHVGGFLTEDERAQLANALKSALATPTLPTTVKAE